MTLADDPVRRLLDEGDGLLAAGRGNAAALVFERLLLQDPAQPEARLGLERARSAMTEAERRTEESVDDARRALDRGDREAARAHVAAALQDDPSRPRALEMLDLLDERSGRLGPLAPPSDVQAPAPRRASRGWTRRAFAAACGIVFASLAVGVAASWDGLLGRLTRAPHPSSPVTSPTLGPLPASEAGRAVADAQRRLEQGDPGGALAALDRVQPADPLYPYAQQLRLQSENARREAHSR